jgi:hypothetical protein
MKKSGVNLFSEPQVRSKRGLIYLQKIQRSSFFLSALTFVSLIVIFVYRVKLLEEIDSANKQTILLQKAMTEELNRQLTSHLLGVRTKTIKSAMLTDIQFANKESQFRQILDLYAIDAKIENITMSRRNEFSISLIFQTQDGMLDFIRSTESDEFKDAFTHIKVGSFRLSKEASNSARLTTNRIQVTGTFHE